MKEYKYLVIERIAGDELTSDELTVILAEGWEESLAEAAIMFQPTELDLGAGHGIRYVFKRELSEA